MGVRLPTGLLHARPTRRPSLPESWSVPTPSTTDRFLAFVGRMTTNGGPSLSATCLTPFLVLGSKPRNRTDVTWLRAEFNVSSAISLLQSHEVVFATEHYQMPVLQCPTPDYTAPTSTDLARALAHVQAGAAQGRTIYVHCKAGKGRSACVCVCVLMYMRGLSLVDAHAYVASRRRIAPLRRRGALHPQWLPALEMERLQNATPVRGRLENLRIRATGTVTHGPVTLAASMSTP
jgi:hypothetical protein